jgi:hypothetical protein
MIVYIKDKGNVIEIREEESRVNVCAYAEADFERTHMEREIDLNSMHYFYSIMSNARSIVAGVEGQIERMKNSSVKPT